MRTAAQEMVFDVVSDAVDRQFEVLEVLNEKATKPASHGTLKLNPSLPLPKRVSGNDFHLSPGDYHTEHAEDDVTAAAVYEHSIAVFAFGQFGKHHNDIGKTLSHYLRLKYPDFSPATILNCGCTIGHDTHPWAETYPTAEVTAIDAAAPVPRYAHAQAESMGIAAHVRGVCFE